jgi:hypothetical protein
MANPQQSEREPFGPVPDANLPGHHDEQDQDRPDLDAFAERFGIVPPEATETTESAGETEAPADASVSEPAFALPTAHLRQPPPGVAVSSTVVRIGSRLVLGPWIIAGRLAETALGIIDRRYIGP